MGTGKSSVGRIVAEHLRFRFVDTDEVVESQAGCSIAEIFAREGEAFFRQCERQALADLAVEQNLVIAAGGGAVVDPANMAGLKSHAFVVCLWASAETIWQRVQHQSHRPLLQTADPLARIRQLLESRSQAYRQADVLIHTGFRSPREVASQVLHQFRKEVLEHRQFNP